MSTVESSPAAQAGPRRPTGTPPVPPTGQPRIRRNDHSVLRPPPLGEWTPRLEVSVVVPAHGHPEKLDLVLASLAAQSYPAHLMEVVVVDDGSSPPLRLPPIRPENCRIVPAAPGGWGSAHAVNTGVAASSGQVVLRLDADMLVYREHVESQMRWHHLADYTAVLGHKLFVDYAPGDLSPERVLTEVGRGRAAGLFDREGAEPHWIERMIDKHDRLRTADRLAYKVFVGATGSLHRSLFEAAGGLDPELVLGGDTEFAYRVAQAGAVFVPDLDTSSWHLGRSQMQTRREAGTRYRHPYVSNRVPDFHLRRRLPGRQWDVPYVDVVVDARGRALEEVDATVSALLTGDTADIRVWLVGPWEELDGGRRRPLDEPLLDLRLVRESFRAEGRVRFTAHPPPRDPLVPFRLFFPAGSTPAPGAVSALTAAADGGGVGLLCVALPGATTADGGTLRLERVSAFARARHLCGPEATEAELDDVVEEVYGSQWRAADGVVDAAGAQEAPADWEARLREAQEEAARQRARADRAERKLRWFTPGLARRMLRRFLG